MEEKPYIFSDGRMTPKDAALYTGFKEGTLANWRIQGIGPKYIKINNRIFYYQKDLDDYMRSGGYLTSTGQG